MSEDGCSFADFKEAIAKRQSQCKQHPHDDKSTLFYEQSGFDVTLDSDGWEAFLYHIRSLEDKTVILKVLTSNSTKSALTSLLNKATDSPNLKSRDIGMPSTSRNDTERDSGLKLQGWISDMGIDGPTFVPKSGYFLPTLVKVCPQKLTFS